MYIYSIFLTNLLSVPGYRDSEGDFVPVNLSNKVKNDQASANEVVLVTDRDFSFHIHKSCITS